MQVFNELDSMCGISDEELTKRFREAVRIDNEIKRVKGAPIAGYDEKKEGSLLRISRWKEKVCRIPLKT